MRWVLLACLLGAPGCLPARYAAYQPDRTSEAALASVSGLPALRYAIPADDPRGSLRVTSFGVVAIDAGRAGPLRAMHAGLVVTNDDDDDTWKLDARELRAIFPSGESVAPSFVNATVTGVPVLEIPPGRDLGVDAYFLVPAPYDREPAPVFDLAWEVRTSTCSLVQGRTRFERSVVSAARAAEMTAGHGLGIAPYWWVDPRFFRPRLSGLRRPRIFGDPPRER
jgi:hypothetical protein